MLETVTAYIEQHQLFPTHGTLIVGVSGGMDSLCLLHLLQRLCGTGKRYPELRLHVAHLNHMLRGEASEQDAVMITRYATDWELPATITAVDVPALAREEQRSLEDAARVARYRFLREVADGQPIVVAHHADDQAETILLHLLRGGGLTGMIGMLPRQQDIIRPLLAVSRAHIIAYCQEQNLKPLEDASNTDPTFLRNRIRHELLPFLESFNPRIRATLLRSADVMHTDLEWIEAQVNLCWPTIVIEEREDTITLQINTLRALPLSLQRHLLRRVTARLCAGQSPLELRHYTLIEQLLSRQHNGEEQTLHLPNYIRMFRRNNEVEFVRLQENTFIVHSDISVNQDCEVLLPIPGSAAIAGTSWVVQAELLPEELRRHIVHALQYEAWSEVWSVLSQAYSFHTIYIDAAMIDSSLQVRPWHAGDRIRPLGMRYEKKVQDIFVDKRIPRADRADIPLFFSTSHCIWVAGICLDDRVRLTRNTQQILRLTVQDLSSTRKKENT